MVSGEQLPATKRLEVFSDVDLDAEEIETSEPVVEGLIYVGLNLLCGTLQNGEEPRSSITWLPPRLKGVPSLVLFR